MEILLLVLLLQLKHCYADFVRQTYSQTVRKGIYGDWTGITHSLDHVWTTWIVLLFFSSFHVLPILAIFGVGLLEGVVHYHIDWVKVHFGIKDHTKPAFWTQFGLDQLAHQITYLAMVWVLLLA
jgi:hypothetical protein